LAARTWTGTRAATVAERPWFWVKKTGSKVDPNKEAYRVEYNLNSEVPFLATKFSDGTDGSTPEIFCFYERPI
jgi:hypothetical protein